MPKVDQQSSRPRPMPRVKAPPVAQEPSEDDVAWGSGSIRMLAYGASGTGKTTFAASFPDPILWLICSGGSRPGELKSIDRRKHGDRIKPRVITGMDRFPSLLDEAAGVATVVLDHASGFADMIFKEILGLEKLPEQRNWGMANQAQYGQLGVQCKEAFRALLNLPGNVVILAQERTFGGKDDGGDPDLIRPTVGASLTPSVTGWLNPAVDFVVNTFKRPKYKEEVRDGKDPIMVRDKGVEYCLRVGPHDVYMTKFRRPPDDNELPEYVVIRKPTANDQTPGYDMIQELINGGS